MQIPIEIKHETLCEYRPLFKSMNSQYDKHIISITKHIRLPLALRILPVLPNSKKQASIMLAVIPNGFISTLFHRQLVLQI